MKDIIIIADSAKQAKQIAQKRYPAQWMFIKKVTPVRYNCMEYIFRVPIC